MRDNGELYEYIGVYVDDLAMAMVEPEPFVAVLMNKYKFKLKGTGQIAFHLGCDFFRDEEGVLCPEIPIPNWIHAVGSVTQTF
jgi:hypothetical protein